MYEAFFNFRRKPFELVPDPDFMYLSRSHKKALTFLDYGIRERAGFLLLTGDVGSGKTTLIRDLLSKKYERVVLAKVFNTRVTSEQLLSMINDDFGLPVAGKDKVTLIRDLNEFLLEQFAAGNHPILIIDEAQNLQSDLLEEVRLLSNLESSHNKLLQIVMVGQPELRETMAGPGLMQLRQRISVNCHLKALSFEETHEYILHRMHVAGNMNAAEFPEQVVELIFQFSRGIPRLVNIICDFLLLAAFADEVRTISPEMASEVLDDLDFERTYWGDDASHPREGEGGGGVPHDEHTLHWLEQRLLAIEDQLSVQVPKTLQSVCDTLNQIKGEFVAQVGRNDENVAERQRVDEVSIALEGLVLSNEQNRPASAGLARRFMDGVTNLSVKK